MYNCFNPSCPFREDAKKWNELENSKTHEALVQYAKDRQIVKRLEELDLPYIIQLLKEYGFIVCDTTECRNKVAEQHDKLQKILEG